MRKTRDDKIDHDYKIAADEFLELEDEIVNVMYFVGLNEEFEPIDDDV